MAKPFIKWVGGKSQLLEHIRAKYPQTIEKYCEPFVGGGAVLFDILHTFQPKKVLINDINKSLINTYFQIQQNCDKLISELSKLQQQYLQKSEIERKEMYYQKRDRFNTLEENIEKASLFIFLNKTCFNGLYCVNSKGLFNVPFNNAKNPLLCDEENLRCYSVLLQNGEIKVFKFTSGFCYVIGIYRLIRSSSTFFNSFQ